MKNPEFNRLAKIVDLPPWITNDDSNHNVNLGVRVEQFALLVQQDAYNEGFEKGYAQALEDFKNEIEINIKRLEK